MFHKSNKKVHYAWIVCFGCALMFFCVCGLSNNVFSVYSPFIMKTWDYSKTQISLITAMRALFQTIAIFLTPRFYKRFSLRLGMLLSGLICAIGWILYGLAEVYPMYLAGSVFAGFGYGLGAMVPISMVLERWFDEKRTLAVSLVSAASGLATIGVPSLITAVIQKYSMETAFLIEGGIIAALVGVSYLIIRNSPEELSLSAYGKKEESGTMPEPAANRKKEELQKQKTLPQKELSRTWWRVLGGMVILSTSYNIAGWSHLSLLCTTEGYPAEIVAIALSAAGGMLMAGKFIFGFMSTRLSLRTTSLIFGVCCVISTFLCCVIRLGTVFMLVVYGFFGGSLTLISIGVVAWVEDWAKPEEYARRVRNFQLLYAGGGLFMSVVPGIMADANGGSYVPFYFIAGICSLIVLLLVMITYRKLDPGEKEEKEKSR